MKVAFIFLISFFYVANLYSQKYSIAKILDNMDVYQSPSMGGMDVIDTVREGSSIVICSYVVDTLYKEFHPDYYWKIYNGRFGYIYANGYSRENMSFRNDEEMEMLKKLGLEGDSLRSYNGKKCYDKYLDNYVAEIRKKSKNQFEFNYEWDYPEYSSAIDINLSISNYSKKTIKYAWFTFVAYDAVGGKLQNLRTFDSKVKCIGPIESYGSGSYEFEHAFWSKVIHSVKVSSITIEYMDGTKKIIANPYTCIHRDIVLE